MDISHCKHIEVCISESQEIKENLEKEQTQEVSALGKG